MDADALLEVIPARLLLRNALVAWPALTPRVPAERIGLRKPATVDAMWIECRSAGGYPISAAHGAWSRLTQPVVCATQPTADGELPELAVERVVTAVAAYLARMPAQLHESTGWRPHVVNGPFDLSDTLRGADDPVYRQGLLVDIRMHAPS